MNRGFRCIDAVDMAFELCDLYFEEEADCLYREAKWIDDNLGNSDKLRGYLSGFLGTDRVFALSDSDVREFAILRKTSLHRTLCGLPPRKIGLLLKIVFRELRKRGC